MKEAPLTPTPFMEGFTAGIENLTAQLMAFLPRIAAALLVLVAGWIIARLIRALIMRTIGHLDQLWQRFVSKQGLEQLQSRPKPARVVGELVFWLLMLVFITIATEILGLGIFGTWLKQIVAYLPLAAAGLLILLVGFIVGSLARDLVTSTATSAGLSHGDLLGRIVQTIILFIAVIIGVDQLGIDIAFISVIAGIMLAAMLGGIALAFGLGARTHVANIIAANQLRQLYQVGDKIQVDHINGRIVDITASRVIVETESGSVDIPAKLFDEMITTIAEKGV